MKTAVIGLTTEDTAKIGNPQYIGGFDFKKPEIEAQKVIAEIQKTSIQILFLLLPTWDMIKMHNMV